MTDVDAIPTVRPAAAAVPEPPTAANELLRAYLCGPEGISERIEVQGDLQALKKKADDQFPPSKVVVIQGEDTLDEEGNRTRHLRVRGLLLGRVVARRYPRGSKSVWIDGP